MAIKKEDVRITKTKAALSSAFFDMLRVTPLSDITVNDLCEKADVRRATFYKHFRDKNDFVIYLIKDVRTRFNDKSYNSTADTSGIKDFYVKCADAIIHYLLKYELAIKNIIDSDVRPTFIEMLIKQNYEDTVERLEKCKNDGMTLFASADVVASILLGGTSHTIVHWFENSEKCSVEELLCDISEFINRILA